jgi:acyl-coenzyme A synthetase/AMP-(fatty) acid ligase
MFLVLRCCNFHKITCLKSLFKHFFFSELSASVNRISNLLLRHGVTRGSVVTLYLPVSPLAVASMLACARIGAMHNVVFAGEGGIRSQI